MDILPPALAQWFPPVQPFNAIHPLVVHFPIALLFAAPVLVVLGWFWKAPVNGMTVAALVLMALGAAATQLAVESGEAGVELVDQDNERVMEVLEQHEELAETTRSVFAGASALFAALVFLPLVLKKMGKRAPRVALQAVFLAAYLGCLLLVANTAHLGGTLVHELGVKAHVVTGLPPASQPGE